MKYRDKLEPLMAGLSPRHCGAGGVSPARRRPEDYKGGRRSNPVISEFHRVLWCGFYISGRHDAVAGGSLPEFFWKELSDMSQKILTFVNQNTDHQN